MSKENKSRELAITLTAKEGMSDYMWSKSANMVKDVLVPVKYLFVREFSEQNNYLHFHGYVKLEKEMRPSVVKEKLCKELGIYPTTHHKYNGVMSRECQQVKLVYDMEGWLGYMEHEDVMTNISKEEMEQAKEHYNSYLMTKKKFPTNHLVHSPVSAIQIWMEKHPEFKFKSKKDFVAILVAMNKEGYDFSQSNNLGKVYFTLLSRINDDHKYFEYMIEKQIEKELQLL